MIRHLRPSFARLTALGLAAALPVMATSTPSPSRAAARPTPPAESAARATPAQDYAPSPEARAKFDALRKEMGGETGEPGSEPGPAAPAAAPTDSLGALFFKMLASLVAVILLAVLSMRLLQRLRRGPGMKGLGSSGSFLFEVMETCHLGPGQRLVAVRMQNKVGVLGVGKDGINYLCTLDGEAKSLEAGMRREGNAAQFGENLAQVLDRFKKPKTPPSSASELG